VTGVRSADQAEVGEDGGVTELGERGSDVSGDVGLGGAAGHEGAVGLVGHAGLGTAAGLGGDAEPDFDTSLEGDAGTGGAPPRQSRGMRDMVLSLVVLLIPVAIIAAVYWAHGDDSPMVVDTTAAITEAQAAQAFEVSPPHGLDSGWRAISAAFDPGTVAVPGALLRIGYVTPAGGSVQLIESNAARDGLLIHELGDNTMPEGVVSVAGQAWNSYQDRNGEHALVLADGARTLIVIGTADAAELQALAASVS
jgi:hypothetical protein